LTFFPHFFFFLLHELGYRRKLADHSFFLVPRETGDPFFSRSPHSGILEARKIGRSQLGHPCVSCLCRDAGLPRFFPFSNPYHSPGTATSPGPCGLLGFFCQARRFQLFLPTGFFFPRFFLFFFFPVLMCRCESVGVLGHRSPQFSIPPPAAPAPSHTPYYLFSPLCRGSFFCWSPLFRGPSPFFSVIREADFEFSFRPFFPFHFEEASEVLF